MLTQSNSRHPYTIPRSRLARLMRQCPYRLGSKLAVSVQAEADFSSLAERLRDGEGQRADRDRAARDALARSAQAEAQLRSTEVGVLPKSCCSHQFADGGKQIPEAQPRTIRIAVLADTALNDKSCMLL